MSGRIGTAVAVGMTWLVVRLIRPSRLGKGSARRSLHNENCRIEECGADGVPLSLYAG